MNSKILVIASFFISSMIQAQSKESLILVNEKQKKIYFDYGQSANKAWYSIGEKTKDTAVSFNVQTYIVDKSKMTGILDSLKKAEFLPKFKKQSVSDLKVTVVLTEHKFFKIDSIKKAPGKTIVDSVFIARIATKFVSEKEKINKSRNYYQKYTTINKAKLEQKLKKYKEYSLNKYGQSEIYEVQFLFEKFLQVNPLSEFYPFNPNEREFF